MKLVTAIIQPGRLEEVKSGLNEAGIKGLTVIDVQGYGQQKGITEVYHGHEYKIHLRHKLKIEIFVSDDKVEDTIQVILKTAKSGNQGAIGDGKIVVTPLEEVVRIRTGERGESAL